jgi:hypothetical protein
MTPLPPWLSSSGKSAQARASSGRGARAEQDPKQVGGEDRRDDPAPHVANHGRPGAAGLHGGTRRSGRMGERLRKPAAFGLAQQDLLEAGRSRDGAHSRGCRGNSVNCTSIV